jgi:DNA-binding MarR family transcriptional regulator
MKSRNTEKRATQMDYVSSELIPRAGLLTRLLVRQLSGEFSRTELGLLRALSGGPRRITELAELEGIAQPTTTILIKQLEQQGLVTRQRQRDDGRVVLVNLTKAGSVALADFRARTSAVLGAYLAEISDEQVDALATATETLEHLLALLQERDPAVTRLM